MRLSIVAGALALALVASGPASGKDALCYTSDDGEYPCAFISLDDAGSFEISGKEKPTFQVWIDSPGMATVGATFEPGGRSVPLPGPYYRSEQDRACWVSESTDAEICAW